jgi:hypothetical protein
LLLGENCPSLLLSCLLLQQRRYCVWLNCPNVA